MTTENSKTVDFEWDYSHFVEARDFHNPDNGISLTVVRFPDSVMKMEDPNRRPTRDTRVRKARFQTFDEFSLFHNDEKGNQVPIYGTGVKDENLRWMVPKILQGAMSIEAATKYNNSYPVRCNIHQDRIVFRDQPYDEVGEMIMADASTKH